MQRRIGILTPVSHLPGVFQLLNTKGEVFQMKNQKVDTIKETLQACQIDTIVCNPNKQSYVLNAGILDDTLISTILTCSTGLSHIDLDYCEENDITVLSLTKDLRVINKLPSTSELAFILMGNLLRKVPQSIQHVSDGGWNYEPFIGRQMAGLKVGVGGCGRLGKMMIHQCHGFMMDVSVYDPYQTCRIKNTKQVDSLEELFLECDVVSIHVHLNEETAGMINDTLLGLPKKQFYLVNTSRGGIVDESAVISALDSGILTGYATDVVADENGTIGNSPIIDRMGDLNIIVTPHIGGMTWEGQEFAYKSAINKL